MIKTKRRAWGRGYFRPASPTLSVIRRTMATPTTNLNGVVTTTTTVTSTASSVSTSASTTVAAAGVEHHMSLPVSCLACCALIQFILYVTCKKICDLRAVINMLT